MYIPYWLLTLRYLRLLAALVSFQYDVWVGATGVVVDVTVTVLW